MVHEPKFLILWHIVSSRETIIQDWHIQTCPLLFNLTFLWFFLTDVYITL